MGKISILTKEQKTILDQITKERPLTSRFYFTGGTALSEFYLKHRKSVDLDFFTDSEFDTQFLFNLLSRWSKILTFKLEAEFIEPTYRSILHFETGTKLRVDFSYFPYKRLKEGVNYNNLEIDSLFDIATNKLLTISQRANVKDFVDLYFLLEKFSLWDLITSVEKKFNLKIEPFILASDLLLVENFEFLPKMIKPLKLPTLKKFFEEEAKKLGRPSVK